MKYCAIRGTCIGAVRHNGFMPWNDDIDVTMPIEDAIKFRQIARNELNNNFKLIDYLGNERNYRNNFSLKIKDIRTTFVEKSDLDIMSVFSFMSISLYKSDWLFKEDELKNIEVKGVIEIFGGQFQEYFSGPRIVAQGLEAIEAYPGNITYLTFINDFLGSVPFISGFVNKNNRINIYYNYFLKGPSKEATTQIMPMITIGYAYFFYSLCLIFIMISVFTCLKCWDICLTKDNLFEKNIYAFFSIWTAMCVGFITQIIFGLVCPSFIPFMAIILFNKRIICKKGNNRLGEYT